MGSGNKVLLVAGGSVFEVLELEDDEHAIVQTVLEAPSKHVGPYWWHSTVHGLRENGQGQTTYQVSPPTTA
ncbi:hypothetical protein [Nocardia sp. SC052]|uniref:hypothetical protein n=1 Tax=Nocardia sichangensis TaxID=3385975 RepID=UPI0039A22906